MRNRLAALASVSAVLLFSSPLLAQAPVSSRDALPDEPSAQPSTQWVVEIQALRQEVSSLRGTIEELEYQIRQLERKQSENYQDLDKRVAGLYSGAVSASPSTPSAPSATTDSGGSDADTSVESRQLYDQGFAALRQGDTETAIQQFRLLLQSHPESKEAPDAQYWLGETYWLANKKEESRQAFVQLLEQAPDYRKAGEVMYRLGVIYDQLGDSEAAFDYMNQVLSSGSSQSVAAQAWINQNPPEKTAADSSEAP